MRTVVELLRTRRWPRAVALALLTMSVAACSAESTRFNENPYATRSATEATGSIASPPGQTARVESQPLPPTTQQVPPPGAGTAGGGRGMASYNPASPGGTQVAARPNPEITGTVAAAPKPAPSGHWTWDGGTPVTVAPGDTIVTIARRHGVPASAILQTNNLAASTPLRAGQPLVIPRYVHAPSAEATPAAVAPKPVAPALASAAHPGVHIVAPGETLGKISHLYGKPLAEVARVNKLAPAARLKVGDRIVIPGVRTSKTAPKGAPAVAQANPAAPAKKEPAQESVGVVTPVAEAPANPAKEATGALPSFRWPARGRVIAGYGPTPNGVQNDGINIALPEGTPVKAAEDGVVAYAGNELKGYGNLLLVRHPNGYVTAYAHAKELLVKRGDAVKRGQVIAHSGQTGNVTAPQLHFEVRKGATPLDPTRYLSGG